MITTEQLIMRGGEILKGGSVSIVSKVRGGPYSPVSHATDHTRKPLSGRSMLIADIGGSEVWAGNPQT
jgi:hypothetical protein